MQIRKAVLTGGGRATRLRPITSTINKHLLPLANTPMIFHAIEKLADAGMKNIFINTNPGDTELPAAVGDGSRWGVRIKYFEQTGGPQGLAHAIAESERFIGDDPFIAYLGDNILLGNIKSMLDHYQANNFDCMLALSQVENPTAFGVPRFDAVGNIMQVIEKPSEPPSNLAVIGIYIYGPKVYFDAFRKIRKSARGEYEISDVHTMLLKEGKRVGYKEITGWWKDTGRPEDLLEANKLLLQQLAISDQPSGSNQKSAISNRKSHNGVSIIEPVIIGNNCELGNCSIGPNVTLGSGCAVRGARLENSILLDGVTIEGNVFLKDSLIGKNACVIGAFDVPIKQAKVIIGDQTVIEF